MMTMDRALSYYFRICARGAQILEVVAPAPEAPRRPSGGEEGEAACRGRRGGGSASPATKDSARNGSSHVGLWAEPALRDVRVEARAAGD